MAKETNKNDYIVADFIKDREAYLRWLNRKATTTRKRDERYGCNVKTRQEYKNAINDAVLESSGVDFYTKLPLDWSLLSRFDGRNYHLLNTSKLPSVDHFKGRCNLKFVICSWLVNGMKGDMTYKKFMEMCAIIAKK